MVSLLGIRDDVGGSLVRVARRPCDIYDCCARQAAIGEGDLWLICNRRRRERQNHDSNNEDTHTHEKKWKQRVFKFAARLPSVSRRGCDFSGGASKTCLGCFISYRVLVVRSLLRPVLEATASCSLLRSRRTTLRPTRTKSSRAQQLENSNYHNSSSSRSKLFLNRKKLGRLCELAKFHRAMMIVVD